MEVLDRGNEADFTKVLETNSRFAPVQEQASRLHTENEENEVHTHAPQFRAGVHVASWVFKWSETFVLDPNLLLQTGFCQPVYNTNVPHGGLGLVYVSSVEIGGGSNYTGPSSKSKKKAEQNAAHVAITSILEEKSESRGLMLEIIRSKYRPRPALNANPNPNSSISHPGQVSTDFKTQQVNQQDGQDANTSKPIFDINLSKIILKEYGDKKLKGHLHQPKYDTLKPSGGPTTVFLSSVEIDGNKYTGQISQSKKEAEKNAAFVAIHSILDDSESKNWMLEVINSKCCPSNPDQFESITDLKKIKIWDPNPTQCCTDLKADKTNCVALSENNCAANCAAGSPLVELVGPSNGRNPKREACEKKNEQLAKKFKVE